MRRKTIFCLHWLELEPPKDRCYFLERTCWLGTAELLDFQRLQNHCQPKWARCGQGWSKKQHKITLTKTLSIHDYTTKYLEIFSSSRFTCHDVDAFRVYIQIQVFSQNGNCSCRRARNCEEQVNSHGCQFVAKAGIQVHFVVGWLVYIDSLLTSKCQLTIQCLISCLPLPHYRRLG